MRVFANQYCFISCRPQGFQKLGGGGDMPYCVPHAPFNIWEDVSPVPQWIDAHDFMLFPNICGTVLQSRAHSTKYKTSKNLGRGDKCPIVSSTLDFFGGTCPPVSPTHGLTPMHFKIMVTRRALFSVSGSVYCL